MEIVATFADARRQGRGVVGLVPTMGYLHEGHLSLVAAAREQTDTVTMSLFVNPLQFGEGEDLDRYPRDLERDAALAADAGVDVLFAPALDEMYPTAPVTRVVVAAMSSGLEGLTRPDHFDGVATVVTKLLAGVQPHRAYFGRKDAQQLAVVRRLVHDLSIPVEIVGCPIIRDASGIALSSRNAYLSADERNAALGLSRGLMAAADAAEAGERDGPTLEAIARTAMESATGVRPEYATLAATSDVRRLASLDEPAFLAVAARVGSTRLIDNIHLDPGPPATADRGVTLTGPGLDRPQGDR
jgi:pantoate--beta-alanine ligase